MSSDVYFCLAYENKKFVSLCNGVGSRIGFWNKLIYHFIPDCIGLLNITCCSDLHDVGFSVPKGFKTIEDAYEYFEQVNWDFLSDLRRRIETGTHTYLIRKSRYFVATRYYDAVQSSIGWTSFMSGKLIAGKKLNDAKIDLTILRCSFLKKIKSELPK
jgi:hypothetical protein